MRVEIQEKKESNSNHTKTNTSDLKNKACEEPFERNSAKITLQLLTTNTTVRKINNEVCAVSFAQVYEGKIEIEKI